MDKTLNNEHYYTTCLSGLQRRCVVLTNGRQVSSVPGYYSHRHRIDKYLDTLLANQPISDGEATDRCQKVAPQDGGLPELIVVRSCLTNHSEAASL